MPVSAGPPASPAPILFRSKAGAGHGSDLALDEHIAEKADVYAFMLSQLEVPFRE